MQLSKYFVFILIVHGKDIAQISHYLFVCMCVFLDGCAAKFMFLIESGLILSCMYSSFLNMATAVFLAGDKVRFTVSTIKHFVMSCIAFFFRLKPNFNNTREAGQHGQKNVLLRVHFYLPFINSHWDVARTESIRLHIIYVKSFEIWFILPLFSLVKIFATVGRRNFGYRRVTSFSLAC